jgi:hypothetical protein
LFNNKQIVHNTNFHLIWWDGIKAVMDEYPKMYQVWITKHVSEFCGTNVQLYYRHKGTHNPKCGCCNVEHEHTTHINRCVDLGHTEIFCISVQDLIKWMQSTLYHQGVVHMVEDYLLSCDEKWMQDCIWVEDAGLCSLAIAIDRLHWDSFLEGHIAQEWIAFVTPLLWGTRICPVSWAKTLITKLLNITHKQWQYRNSCMHYSGQEGITLEQHRQILQQVFNNIHTNPDTLLPQHWYLLEVNPTPLGGGSTATRRLWLASLESAKSAAELSRTGMLSETAKEYFSVQRQASNG